MDIGRLDRYLTIQSRTTTRAADGTPNPTYSTLKYVWGSRQNRRGDETHDSEREVFDESATYWLRYDQDITRGMRLVDGSNTYKIRFVEEVSRQEMMVVECEKFE